MNTVKITVAEIDPESRVAELEVEGILDTRTSPELEKALDSLIDSGIRLIIINLVAVEYISTAGWCAIISKASLMREGEGEFYLAGMIPNVQENFAELEFQNLFKTFESVKAARQSRPQILASKS